MHFIFLLTVSSESEGEDGEDMDISTQFDEPSPDNTDLNKEEVVEAVNVPPPIPPPRPLLQDAQRGKCWLSCRLQIQEVQPRRDPGPKRQSQCSSKCLQGT